MNDMPLTPGTEDYWRAMVSVAEEVLSQAKATGFGMSEVSIKYADSKPVIVVRSHSENRRYRDNKQAKRDVEQIMDDDIANGFNGTRSFTAVYDRGHVTRIIIDDYRNIAL